MNPKENDTFYLESDGEEKLCRVITTFFSETRKKYYLLYEYAEEDSEDVFVSSYEIEDDTGELHDVTNEEELVEIASFLNEFEEESL